MRTPAQTLRHGPTALPPLPTTPPRPTPAIPQQRLTARQRRVGANGAFRPTPAITINLGTDYAATQITVITSGHTIDIFDTHGAHIRSITLTPARTYYGTGKPRGRNSPPNRPH